MKHTVRLRVAIAAVAGFTALGAASPAFAYGSDTTGSTATGDSTGELLGTRADAEPEAVAALVGRCARLPLALRVAAEIARSRPGRALGELAAELADRQDALDLLVANDDPHTAVRTVFSWSYRRLDPVVARVFRLLGLHHGQDIDVHAVAALAGTGRRETRRALDVPERAHLVDQSPGGRYQAHDLLRAYAAELAAATDGDADRDAAFRRLDRERADLLTATHHGEPDHVGKASETVWRHLGTGGYHD